MIISNEVDCEIKRSLWMNRGRRPHASTDIMSCQKFTLELYRTEKKVNQVKTDQPICIRCVTLLDWLAEPNRAYASSKFRHFVWFLASLPCTILMLPPVVLQHTNRWGILLILPRLLLSMHEAIASYSSTRRSTIRFIDSTNWYLHWPIYRLQLNKIMLPIYSVTGKREKQAVIQIGYFCSLKAMLWSARAVIAIGHVHTHSDPYCLYLSSTIQLLPVPICLFQQSSTRRWGHELSSSYKPSKTTVVVMQPLILLMQAIRSIYTSFQQNAHSSSQGWYCYTYRFRIH